MISGSPDGWSLDAQLARDCILAGDLALSRVLLNADANYPWLILVPRRARLVELIDLDEMGRGVLMREIAEVARALKAITGCDKLNVAALGNVVAQLHVHVIARFKTDAAWPNPVWGKAPRRDYVPTARDRLLLAIRERLQIEPDRG
jgi:diadenosine tetraphosphate (Ap4A) HIT family hydrolase